MELWEAVGQSLRTLGDRTAISTVPGSTGPQHVQAWSGNELLALTEHFADLILSSKAGITGSRIVAVYLSNSVAYVAAILATLRIGGAFLPLDPRWPEARLRMIIETARPVALVWADYSVRGGHGQLRRPAIPDWCSLLQLPTPLTQDPMVLVSSQYYFTESKARRDGAMRIDRQTSSFAYVLYTSGSTGIPLGVCGTAQGILLRCRWMADAFPFVPEQDKVAFKTAPCFVDSIWEIFGPLLGCVQLVAVPLEISTNPASLATVLVDHGITHMTAIPSMWGHIARVLISISSRSSSLKLRQAVSSGEGMPTSVLAAMRSVFPRECRIINLYGSTETAADATFCDCTDIKSVGIMASIPIGTPLPGFSVALAQLNGENQVESLEEYRSVRPLERLVIIPPVRGTRGEILIGSRVSLATSYLGNEEATTSRFIHLTCADNFFLSGPDPAVYGCQPSNLPSLRFFRTGDIGEIDDRTGQLYVVGRTGLCAKLHGVRVDLLEVERTLLEHEGVGAAAVKVWHNAVVDSHSGSNPTDILAAYVELAESSSRPPTSADLRDWCMQYLPSSAVPQQIFVIDIPRSAAGKVDRMMLPPPDSFSILNDPRDEGPGPKKLRKQHDDVSESVVHAAFSSALGRGNFEPTSSLFSEGGTSATVVQIASFLGTGIETVFQYPTVRSLTAALQHRASSTREHPGHRSSSTETRSCSEIRAALRVGRIQSRGSPRQGSSQGKPRVKRMWKRQFSQCVDTYPLLTSSCVLASSHGGEVKCFDAASGAIHWVHVLEGHSDIGLATCQCDCATISKGRTMQQRSCLIAATQEGSVFFLDQATGDQLLQPIRFFDEAFGVRSPPMVDPWRKGLVWLAGHGKRLIAIKLESGTPIIAGTAQLSAAVSSRICFADQGGQSAYVACLDGSVHCIHIDGALHMRVRTPHGWTYQCDAPVFADPIIISAGRRSVTGQTMCGDAPALVVLTVSGTVTALDLLERGTPLWKCLLDDSAGFFTSPLNCSLSILIGSHSGKLFKLSTAGGHMERSCQVADDDPVTGIAPIRLRAHRDGQGDEFHTRYVVLLTAEGTVLMINAEQFNDTRVVIERLPAATFAIAADGCSFAVGCRDNNVYMFTAC